MQNLVTIKDSTDPKSYDDKHVDHSLEAGYCVLAQNCFLDDNRIYERTGYSMVANDTGENKPNLGFGAYESGSFKQLLKINNDATNTAANLFYWNGSGNWVKVNSPTFTQGARCCMVQAQGKMYITNGVDVVKKWDGATLTNVAAIPITPYLQWFHNFMFALKGSKVYFSNVSDPETWSVGALFDISPEDGDAITGSSVLKDELMVGKYYKTYSFQGWTEASFNISQVNEQLSAYGCTSDDSFVNIGNDLLFMSFSGGIPHIRSITRTRLAETMYGGTMTDYQEGTMKGLSKGYLGMTAGIFDGRRAWFFMPNGTQVYNDLTLVYDTLTKGWTKHTGIYAARATLSTVTGTVKVYFADSRNSKVYVFDGSFSDNGNPIEFKFMSKRYMPDAKRYFHWKYLFFHFEKNSTGNLSVYTSVDDNLPDLQETVSLLAGTSMFPYIFPIQFGNYNQATKRINLPYGSDTINIQVMFYKNDTTAPVEIHDYQFMGYPRKIRYLD